jgi:long-chain acyl-CoA synthetase
VTSGPYTLRDHLTAQARRFEKKTFLEHGAERYSYRAIDGSTDHVATALGRLGLRRGERVAIVLPARPELVFFLWGAPKVGLVPVPIDASLERAEIASRIEQAQVSALVTERAFADLASPSARHVILVDDEGATPDFAKFMRGPALDFWPDLDAGDPAALVFTHGRDGRRRGVLLSHDNLIANATQLLQPLRVNASDRFFSALPLASSSGLVLQLLLPWTAGACAVLTDLKTSALPAELERHRITVVAAPPALYGEFARMERRKAARRSPALRLAACIGGAVGDAVQRSFEERYDALIVEGYALTEATCVACANPYTGVRKPGSLGLPLPGLECRIEPGPGRSSDTPVRGEILLRGPNVMKGYFDDPVATDAALRDGWLHTGDLGYVDSDGYYHLVESSLA